MICLFTGSTGKIDHFFGKGLMQKAKEKKSKKNDVVPETPENGESTVSKEESKKSKKQLGLFNLKKGK